ncbi:MAG: VanZ family protein [Gemmataceae bacterium]
MQMVLIWNTCWWLLLVLWTIGLLRPEPIQMQHELISPALSWVTAKGLHLGVYALLAFFASNLPGTYSNKLICYVILVAHAFATEFFQQWVKERTGSITDVGINLTGIVLGLGLITIKRFFMPGLRDG